MASTTMMRQRALTAGTSARCTASRVLLPVRAAPTHRMGRGSGRGLQQLVRAQSQSEEDQPKLTREAEPEEYWVSKGERKGANPMADPLAIIGVVAILFPFLFLGLAIVTGVVDVSVYR